MKAILNRSLAYDLFQWALGGDRPRRVFADEHVRALPGQSVVDVGCGTGEMLRHLRGVVYTGFDINPRYIRTARQRYGQRARFECEDLSAGTLGPAASCDVVIAAFVLHHLGDDEVKRLCEAASAVLKPSGRFVSIDPGLMSGQSPIARAVIRHDRGRHVRTNEGYRALVSPHFRLVKESVRHDLMRIPYTHVILECTKS